MKIVATGMCCGRNLMTEAAIPTLDQTILERHSIRKFLPAPVPRDLVDEALALAQHAPSNSNIQPWRLVFVSGAARDRLKHALFSVADHEAPHIPSLPKAFEHYRYEPSRTASAGAGRQSSLSAGPTWPRRHRSLRGQLGPALSGNARCWRRLAPSAR